MISYNDACMEVSTILSFLDIEEYNKIPKDVIEVIERNKNTEYIFEINENIELKEQNLLKETKAILFNIFRDYLASSEQREKIIKFQKAERQKLNEIKQKNYNYNNIFNNNNQHNNNNNEIKITENTALCEIKENFITKIIKFFKKIFHI